MQIYAPYDIDPIMPPLNDKNNIAAPTETEISEIITPLDVHAARKTENQSIRRWATLAVLTLALLSIVSTGGWFLKYLSNQPFDAKATSKVEVTKPESRPAVEAPPDEDNLAEPTGPAQETAETVTHPKQLNDRREHPNRKEALALVAIGREHESGNALHLAQAAYQKAFELDPDDKEAGLALNRVSAEIRDRQYRQAMSEGLEAYAKADYARSRKYLLKAKSLKPGTREPREALAKVDQTVLAIRVKTLNQNGQSAEQIENWPAAGRHYAKVLELDPGNEFAKRGRERTLKYDRIYKELQRILNQPNALTSSKNIENAATLVSEGQKLESRGPVFKRALEQVEQKVVAARRPVRLTITSDNQTQVDVYRIGRLGRFSRKELDLKPGVYTVVGYRDGYQDVRQQVVIDPGQENLRVTIICKVKV